MMQNRLSTSLSMIQSVWADYRYGLLIVLVMVTFLPFRPVGSPDTWKHLVDGQYLSWFHAMPHYSTFTLTPVKEVIPGDSYDWLGSLILYQVYHGGGYTGLQFLRLVVPCTMLFLLVSLNERRCDGIWFLSSLVVIYGLEATYDVRASVFGPIVFGLELYLLIKFHDTKRLRYLWFVPPVLMVWGNLHGSYLIGIYVFLLFVLGFFMDRVFSDSQDWSLKNMVSCGLIVLLTFVAVIYVKPFPNYEPVQRLNGVLEFFRVPAVRSTSSTGVDFFSALKDVTYGVAVEDRAIVADEFRFTLSKVHRPYYLFLLVVLPFFYVLSLIRSKKTSLFYTILPSLFLLWIGIGVTRAAPYAGIGLFVFAIVEMSGGEGFKFKGSWICSLKENFIPRNKELSRLVAPGISVFIFVSLVLFLSSEQYQLGKTVFTEKTTGKIKEVLRRYPDVPAFTSGMVGGYVLWHWWPYKKVFFQPKTTAVPDRFMRRMTKAHSTPKRTYGTIMEHGIKLALLTEPMYNRGRNFFGIHPDWIQGVSPDYPEDVAIYCHKALCGDPENPPPKKVHPLAR